MKNRQIKTVLYGVELQLEALTSELQELQGTDERYKVVTERIADLVKIREDLKGRKVEGLKMDTIVNGVISIAGIVLVTKHEKLDIITSKAFGIATKLIGR